MVVNSFEQFVIDERVQPRTLFAIGPPQPVRQLALDLVVEADAVSRPRPRRVAARSSQRMHASARDAACGDPSHPTSYAMVGAALGAPRAPRIAWNCRRKSSRRGDEFPQ